MGRAQASSAGNGDGDSAQVPPPDNGHRPDGVEAPLPGSLPFIRLMGVSIHAIGANQCLEHLFESLDAGRGGWVVTPNLDHLRRLVRDRSYAALCRGASLVVPDGMPLIWASRLQGTELPARVAGSDLIRQVSSAAAQRGRSVFLLGGTPGSAAGAARVLRQSCPGLQVVGTCCPPVGFEQDGLLISHMVNQLTRAKPDVIFVALGSPKQEELITALRQQLPRAWWIGVGISFSFLTGDVRRAPCWMQRIGMEWVHRLAQEPRRLARRYLIDGIPFAFVLFANALSQRLRPSRG